MQARSLASEAYIPPLAENDDRIVPLAETADEVLMARTGQGDASAFSILVERHTSSLYRVSYRVLRDAGDAEDIVQECFTRLWVSAPSWRPIGGGLVGWLHRVAINLCLDRKRKFSPIVTDAFPDIRDEAPLPDEAIEGRQTASVIERALTALPAHYHMVLVLSYYEGFPNAVVAEIMDMNVKALESLLVRARRHLRKLLQLEQIACSDLGVLA